MQKKNRKGFTLIELLAVIVILAIIALIAVPVIMNVITKARKSAFEDSAYGIVKAGEMYYTNKLLDTEGMTKNEEFTVDGNVFKNSEGKTLDISGSIPSSGKVTVTSEGKVALAISNGEYCIRKATTESKVKAEKLSDLGGTCNYKTVFTTASDGTSVPACITNNTECSAGTKVGVQVNDSETKDFYVMSEDTEDNKITLIMSGRVGEPWNWSNGMTNEGPVVALAYLESKTSGWNNIPETTYELIDDNTTPQYEKITRANVRARLITYTETIALGCTEALGSCPTWLYGNSNSDSIPWGYWTSSGYVEDESGAWTVNYDGSLGWGIVIEAYYEIRPVITVSKTIL